VNNFFFSHSTTFDSFAQKRDQQHGLSPDFIGSLQVNSHLSTHLLNHTKIKRKTTFITKICIYAIFLLPLQTVTKNDYEYQRKNRILAQPSG
jgi:hypothetical protein